MIFAKNKNVRISCRLTGAVEANPSALFIHGMNTNMAFWHPLLVRRLGCLRRIAMFDLRGHGGSDQPPSGYTSRDLADDALAVLDQLHLDEVDVVAHSFGATVALQLFRLYPERVRSLVVLDGRARVLQPEIRLGEWSQFDRWKEHFASAGITLDPNLEMDFYLPLLIDDDAWAAARENLISDGFFAPSSSKRAVEKYRKLLTETTAPRELRENAGLTHDSMRKIVHPTLAVYGSFSPYLPTQEMLQNCLPNCVARRIDRAGHNFPLINPQHTADAIESFWLSCQQELTA